MYTQRIIIVFMYLLTIMLYLIPIILLIIYTTNNIFGFYQLENLLILCQQCFLTVKNGDTSGNLADITRPRGRLALFRLLIIRIINGTLKSRFAYHFKL